jgi:hypothetical protein
MSHAPCSGARQQLRCRHASKEQPPAPQCSRRTRSMAARGQRIRSSRPRHAHHAHLQRSVLLLGLRGRIAPLLHHARSRRGHGGGAGCGGQACCLGKRERQLQRAAAHGGALRRVRHRNRQRSSRRNSRRMRRRWCVARLGQAHEGVGTRRCSSSAGGLRLRPHALLLPCLRLAVALAALQRVPQHAVALHVCCRDHGFVAARPRVAFFKGRNAVRAPVRTARRTRLEAAAALRARLALPACKRVSA